MCPLPTGACLPGGTAYQTDVGMTGPYESVIGVVTEDILKRFRTGPAGALPHRQEGAGAARGPGDGGRAERTRHRHRASAHRWETN